MARWVDRFVPPNIRSGDERRRARLTAALPVPFAAVALMSAALIASDGRPAHAVFVVASGVAALATMPMLRATGSLRLTANLQAAVLAGSIFGLSSVNGGIGMPSMYGLLLLPIVVSLVQGRNAGIAWASIAVACVLGLEVLHVTGVVPPTAAPDLADRRLHMVGIILLMLISLFTTLTYDWMRARALAELHEESVRADTASRIKSEFLANMSHEIRTPLNGLVGMLHLLKHTELTERQRDYVESILHSSSTLLDVVNDVLDLSKIEAGRLEVDLAELDVIDEVEDVVVNYSTAAEAKQLELIADIDPNLPRKVFGDARRLRQVLNNLVSNAIKFTDEGEVIVRVCSERADEDAVQLRFEVTDTGIGIPREDHQRLFEAFTQADTSTARRYGGTGLGLTISMRLVELMGGELGVDSEVGKGSTFGFSLRLHAPQGRELRGQVSNTGRSVLIAAQNAAVRSIVGKQLQFWGLVCTEASTVDELRAALERGQQDVAIIDLGMLGADWRTVMESLHSDEARRFVALCSVVHGTSELLRAGFSVRLDRPVRSSQLGAAVDGILAADPVSRNDLPTVSANAERISVDTSGSGATANVLVAEDNPTNQRVVRGHLRLLGYRYTLVDGGAAAVEALCKPDHGFDAVLMDCQMPDMDGYEATARIRAYEKAHGGGRVPIVALTAHAMPGDRDAVLQAGMDWYLAKPFDTDGLARALGEFCGASQSEDPPPLEADEQPSTMPPPGAGPALDPAILSELREIDQDDPGGMLRDVFTTYLEDAPERLETMSAAVAEGNLSELRDAAHALKGSSRTVGALELGRLCEDVERSNDKLEERLDDVAAEFRRVIRAIEELLATL